MNDDVIPGGNRTESDCGGCACSPRCCSWPGPGAQHNVTAAHRCWVVGDFGRETGSVEHTIYLVHVSACWVREKSNGFLGRRVAMYTAQPLWEGGTVGRRAGGQAKEAGSEGRRQLGSSSSNGQKRSSSTTRRWPTST